MDRRPSTGGDVGVDVAHDHGHLAALAVDVDAEATQAVQGDRQVAFQCGFELADLRLAHHRIGQPLDALGRQRLFLQPAQHPLDLDPGRSAGREEQVGAAVGDHGGQVVAEVVVVGRGQGWVHGAVRKKSGDAHVIGASGWFLTTPLLICVNSLRS
jgi:hypothetical protein